MEYSKRRSLSWKICVAFFALFVLAACRVINATPGSVHSLDNEGNYSRSISQIKQAAQDGSADDQYALGYSYFYGKGVPRDEDTAIFWIRKAAAQGQPQAVKALVLIGKSDSIYNDNSDVDKPNPTVTDSKITPPPQGASPIMTRPQTMESAEPMTSEKPDCAYKPPEYYSGESANAMIRQAEKKALEVESDVNPTMNKNPGPTTSTTTPPAALPVSANESATHLAAKAGPATAPSAVVASTPAATESSSGLKLEDLMQSPGNYYTIQLLAASQENEITRYVQSHDLGGKTVSYRANRNGKDWYILSYGVYKSREEAETVLRSLPNALRGLKPWVNSIASVKVSMAKTTA